MHLEQATTTSCKSPNHFCRALNGWARHSSCKFLVHLEDRVKFLCTDPTKALWMAHTRPLAFGHILRATKAIVFLAVPQQENPENRPLSMDIAIKRIALALRVHEASSLDNMLSWSKPLTDLQEDFAQLAPRFQIANFLELHKTTSHDVRLC